MRDDKTKSQPRISLRSIRATDENNALLADIGARVRTERAKRGVTRKTLALQCQTSERYLAQIESGEANPSVLVLDKIARALDLDPIDLMPAGRVRAAHRTGRIARRREVDAGRGAGETARRAIH